MSNANVNPTREVFSQFQVAGDYFNDRLFEGELPPVVFSLQRGKKTSGYFSPMQWRHIHGAITGEIAVNPSYLAGQTLLRVFQTIVHVQCHLWQHQYGNPSRPGYHNSEWAGKMIEIGLMPSSTGEPGGYTTGQRMLDYPIKGEFLAASAELVSSGFGLSWIDQGFGSDISVHGLSVADLQLEPVIEKKLLTRLSNCFPGFLPVHDDVVLQQKRKTKYQCFSCHTNAWGKVGLSIICGNCGQPFSEVQPTSRAVV